MKTQQTTISEVRLVYRTKVKASDRLQVKCSKDAIHCTRAMLLYNAVLWNVAKIYCKSELTISGIMLNFDSILIVESWASSIGLQAESMN